MVGFQFDGEALATIYLTNKQSKNIVNNISINSHWQKMPMSEKLSHQIANASNSFDNVIPTITNGYWILKNNASNINDIYNEKELWENTTSGYHYTVGILDLDTNILYYYLYEA